MPARPGQKMVGSYVDTALAARFAAWARQTDGGASAALRRLIADAVDGRAPAAPRGAGTGAQVGVRFKEDERAALAEAARARGCSPANWLRSLALVHLARRPQWTPAEVEALRAVFRELRAIRHGVDRIARAMEDAGGPAAAPADAVREVGAEVRAGMRRVVAVMTGNFDYWGLPDAERPAAAPGAAGRAGADVRAAEARRRNQPRRRAARFDAGG